ncbi:hypothetical protein [Spirillospora sp. NPDC047279]|uniref:hypothetical protein n=1 Tax=Spirillospora sp. NPDC047279 TaxID=3155478 RepID=UPI0034060ACE
MSTRMWRALTAGALAAFLVSGVLAVGHWRSWWAPDPPRDPGALVLRVRFVKGMGISGERAAPAVSVYGDGRAIVASLDLGSTPAREQVREMRFTGGAYRAIYRDAHLAGLGASRTHRNRQEVIDGGLTEITFLSGGRRHVTTVHQAAGGARVWLIHRLIDRLGARSGVVEPSRDDLTGPPRAYRADRVAVMARRISLDGISKDAGATRPWPFRRPVAELNGSYTCALHTGAEAEGVARLLGSAAPNSSWSSGERRYALRLRPLLPDETDCESLPE